MRRRSRRAPNNSESTGKTGAEIPSNQPAPLVPLYPDETPPGSQHGRTHAQPRSQAPSHPSSQAGQPPRGPRPERPERGEAGRNRGPSQSTTQQSPQQWNAGAGRLEVETQPDMSPTAPLAEPDAAERSPQQPKGYVVL